MLTAIIECEGNTSLVDFMCKRLHKSDHLLVTVNDCKISFCYTEPLDINVINNSQKH